MQMPGGENNPNSPHRPLRSDFEDDPDLKDLVGMYVDDLDQRMEAVKAAFETADEDQLRRLAHQIKGSAGGYGFGPIGDVAAELEYELLREEADISQVQERVEDLASICRAAVRPDRHSGEGSNE